MRLVTFLLPGAPLHERKLGALIDGDRTVVDLAAAHRLRHRQQVPYFETILTLIDGGSGPLDVARRLAAAPPEDACHRSDDVRILSPVPTPRRMRDFMSLDGNSRQRREARYRAMAARAADPEAAFARFRDHGLFDPPRVRHEKPIYYKCNALNMIAPGADIAWPGDAHAMECEIELGVFIAARAKNVTPRRARDFVFGYTILNDISAHHPPREFERAHPDLAKGKSREVGHAIGPCLVTADEVADPHDLAIVVRVNGEERARANSADMIHRVDDMISHVSRDDWLHPGEFLGSGTARTLWSDHVRALAPGDVVDIEVESIGVLSNHVAAAAPSQSAA